MISGRTANNLSPTPPAQAQLSEADFTAMLCAHASQLQAYLRRHVPPELAHALDVSDVEQDVYLEAFRRRNQFRPVDDSSARRWLLTIARNQIIDHVRYHGAHKRSTLRRTDAHPPADADLPGMLEELALYLRTPSQSAVSHERHLQLQQAIEQLDQHHQRAIKLRYLEAQPVKAIARAFGRTERAVHMLCNRAIKQLRQKLRASSDRARHSRDGAA